MQVENRSTFVRVLQLRRADPETNEQVVNSWPIEPGKTEHIPDDVWAELKAIDDGKRLWGLNARPDAKLDLVKIKSASEAISKVIACSDLIALNAALQIETRKSVIAALHARVEEVGGEASN